MQTFVPYVHTRRGISNFFYQKNVQTMLFYHGISITNRVYLMIPVGDILQAQVNMYIKKTNVLLANLFERFSKNIQ